MTNEEATLKLVAGACGEESCLLCAARVIGAAAIIKLEWFEAREQYVRALIGVDDRDAWGNPTGAAALNVWLKENPKP